MQKQVSKHGLLVLTLSILLAVSMCLTATFAAFAQNTAVNGTVSFSDGIQIKANGTTTIDGSVAQGTFNINFKVDLGSAHTKTQGNTNPLTSVVISAGEATYFWKATLTLDAQTYASFNTGATPSTIAMANVNPTIAANTITWNKGSTAVAANTTTTLDIAGLISDLPIAISAAQYSAIGAAATDPTITATLTIYAAYSQIA